MALSGKVTILEGINAALDKFISLEMRLPKKGISRISTLAESLDSQKKNKGMKARKIISFAKTFSFKSGIEIRLLLCENKVKFRWNLDKENEPYMTRFILLPIY